MELGRRELNLLAREMAEAAGQLLRVIRAMDDLGWSTDSYNQRHLRGVADSLHGSAARIAAAQRDQGPVEGDNEAAAEGAGPGSAVRGGDGRDAATT